MILSEADLQKLHELAIAAAQRAGAHIQAEVGGTREVMNKDGHTLASQVVTEVDFESQRLILEALDESLVEFDLGLLTEESVDDASRHSREYFWCIDPIDGTLPFIENVAGYSVSIGLVDRAGSPIVGVILDPVTDTVYHAYRGGGAYRNGVPIDLEPGRDLTLVCDRSLAKQDNYEEVLEQLRVIASEQGLADLKVIDQGGAAMNACWVIDHAPAVYFKLPKPERGGGALWDFAASACLFGQLDGAVVGDFSGEPLKLNRTGEPYMNREGVVYASSAELAGAVYRLSR